MCKEQHINKTTIRLEITKSDFESNANLSRQLARLDIAASTSGRNHFISSQ